MKKLTKKELTHLKEVLSTASDSLNHIVSTSNNPEKIAFLSKKLEINNKVINKL